MDIPLPAATCVGELFPVLLSTPRLCRPPDPRSLVEYRSTQRRGLEVRKVGSVRSATYRSDDIQRVFVLVRDVDLYPLPRKVGVFQLSPQLFRQFWQVSTLCVGMAAQHYMPTARHSGQYLMLQSKAR